MHRDDSLSEMMGERGRGLADLKGWDPLDRRIEVEKKEKYGQALRDQMAMNSARGSPSRTGDTTALSPLPPSRPSSCTRAGEAIAAPHSMMHGSVVADSSPASKVAQVQELMRQRLQAVQEEQQRQWQEVQHALSSQLHAAREAAEEAVRLQFGDLISRQGAELQAMQKALSDMMSAQKHSEEQSGRQVDSLAGQLADARLGLQRLEAESGAWQSQLQGLRSAVDDLAQAKQTHAAQQDAAQRDLAEAKSAMQRLQLQSEELMNRMQSQAHDMERLRSEKQDCMAAHAECARDRASLAQRLQEVETGLRDAHSQLRDHRIEIDRLKVVHQELRIEMQQQFQQVQDEQARLGRQILEVQGAVSRLPREVPQLPRAATPPVSAPPPPPPDPMPDVSENAYAVLRGAEGELFELPALENVIGRSAACDTCIPGSQAISNRHMCISFASDGTASLRDIGSRNGTFLNDHRVAATALVMKSGDKVQLGVDGPSFVFTWGPAYYARWPRELQRASGARGRSASRVGRQG